MTGRVLVVDDLAPNVRLLEAKLNTEYYTVEAAYSGQEALDKAHTFEPDVILLDVMMPEMDGYDTCLRLKADPETMHIPVVMVTALSEVKDRIRGLEAGATDFITKPIDEVHLFARVKSLVRVKQMLDELRMRDRTSTQFGVTSNEDNLEDENPIGNIVLVDDDIVQSKRLAEILTTIGHQVQTVEPEEAVEQVTKIVPDVVVVNTILDDQDGLRLCTQIRSNEKLRQVPVIILVDEDDKQRLVKGLEIGIDDYVMTPLEPNELIARVRTQLRRKNYQDQLRNTYKESISAALVDSLTGLYNRRYLDAHVQNIVDEAKAKRNDLSVMTIDIDHFKHVNDKPGWGHHIGDEILQQVGQRILGNIRSTDLATRPGGEEFVVVMPGATMRTAHAVAERTRLSMANVPFTISADPGNIKITVSIGVSTMHKHAEDNAEEILKRSDEALYEAKNTGRNKVCIKD